MAGEIDRAAVPTALEYIQQHALRLAPHEERAAHRGGWITTECRIHGGSDSLRWNTRTNGWKCMACEAHGSDAIDYHMQAYGLTFPQAAQELGAWRDSGQQPVAPTRPAPVVREPRLPVREPSRRGLSPAAMRILQACTALHGTPGEAYLRARRCAIPPHGSHLGFHADLLHVPTGYRGPALVALVTHAVTREPLTLHRTWIRDDGKKADVDPPRMLLADHTKQEGVVRLWPDDAVSYGLAVAEGIETALSLAHSYSPVWACIDAGNLGALPVLRGVESLLIAADNDPAGRKGAEQCAARWWGAGAEVLITQQSQNDLNDALAEADT